MTNHVGQMMQIVWLEERDRRRAKNRAAKKEKKAMSTIETSPLAHSTATPSPVSPANAVGSKHVPTRSHKETATAIRKDIFAVSSTKAPGPLTGIRVEVRRTGQKRLTLAFTHHSQGKIEATAEWLASPAGQEAEIALRALLADYRDGVPEQKTPKDPVPFTWEITVGKAVQ